MKKNIGSYDKLIRLGLAIILIILFYKQILTSSWGIISLLVALDLSITSLLSFSPIYVIFGWNTGKMEEK